MGCGRYKYLYICCEHSEKNVQPEFRMRVTKHVHIYLRFTKDRPRFTDTLDVVKFICKDLWSIMFKKQIDNLKTNHRVRISVSLLLS